MRFFYSRRQRNILCLAISDRRTELAAKRGKPLRIPPAGKRGKTKFLFVFADDFGGLFADTSRTADQRNLYHASLPKTARR